MVKGHDRFRRAFSGALTGQITLLIAIAILPVLIFGSVVLFRYYHGAQQAVERDLFRRVEVLATLTDQFSSRQIRLLETLAASMPLDNGSAADIAAFREFMVRAREVNPEWLSLALIDPADGRQLINANYAAGETMPEATAKDSLARIAATGRPEVFSLARERTRLTRQPVIGVRVPLIRDGSVKSVLGALVTIDALQSLFDSGPVPANWTAAILDAQGVIIARNRAPDEYVGRQATGVLRIAIENQSSGLLETTTLEGTPSYTVFQKIGPARWVVVLSVPQADVSPLRQREFLAVFAGGIASVLMAAVLAFMLARMIAQSRVALERRRRLEATQRALGEKDVLLREIHHRVKNNLATVVSLLHLQSRRLPADIRAAFTDCIRRVTTMSRVHDQLYRSADLARIDLRHYVDALVADVATAYGADHRGIACAVSGDTTEVDLDTATPLGLVISEGVSNAVKHGFPAGRGGRVEVAIAIEPEWVVITIRDDGIGLGDENPEDADGLGVKLMRQLAQGLEAELSFRSDGGSDGGPDGGSAVRCAIPMRRLQRPPSEVSSKG